MKKHDKQVLSKYVNDPTFKVKGAMEAWDMSRMGTINKLKGLAVEALRELGKTRLQTLLNRVE